MTKLEGMNEKNRIEYVRNDSNIIKRIKRDSLIFSTVVLLSIAGNQINSALQKYKAITEFFDSYINYIGRSIDKKVE